jgi:FKBP-type peptidyl-prolyl cis-trans isomerase 2
MKVAAGCIVTIDYELRADGKVIESSGGKGLPYTQGEGKMLPALEKKIEGMAIGEEKKGVIPARDAVGDEESFPKTELFKKEFPDGVDLKVGLAFASKTTTGQPITVKVVGIEGDKVAVRMLPPLAGKDVSFRVKVLLIDDPKNKKRAALVPPPPPAALKKS